MPARSSVASLPADIREELDRRLVSRGFGGYDELVDWLAERGQKISRSALHRHGQKVERRIEDLRLSTEAALALRSAVPDDDGAFSEVTLRMIQERIFKVLVDTDEDDPDIKALASAARSVADAARAGARLREERRKVLREAAKAAGAVSKRAGLSKDTAAMIRQAIEGADA